MPLPGRWSHPFIGGLREKTLAAHRGGIKTVLIPKENAKDLVEIPDNIKNKLEIYPVKWIDEVLSLSLERKPEPRNEKQAEEVVNLPAKEEEKPSRNLIKH